MDSRVSYNKHGEQSNTHYSYRHTEQYTAELYMDSRVSYNKHGEQSNTQHMENEQGEREREIENVSGEPQVNFIISASSKVRIVNSSKVM